MTIRELVASLGIEMDESSFKKADAALETTTKGVLALGAVVAAAGAAVGAMVLSTVKAASEINDLSQRTGENATELQRLAYASKLGGVGLESLAMSMQFASRQIDAASRGEGQASKAFARLGISVRKSNGTLLSSGDLMKLVADRFQQMPNGVAKTSLAMDLFGRAGAQLIPVLNGGSAELERLGQRAEELGFVMDAETIKAGDDLGDSLDELAMAAVALRGAIAGPLLKPLTEVVQWMIEWIRQNRALIAQKVNTAVNIIGKAVTVLWRFGLRPMVETLKWVVTHWKLLAILLVGPVLLAINANIVGIAVLIKMLSMAAWAAAKAGWTMLIAWAKAALPVIAFSAAVAALIVLLDDLIVFALGGDSAMGRFLKRFTMKQDDDHWIVATLKDILALIFDLEGGFTKVISFWKNALLSFFSWLTTKMQGVSESIRKAFESVLGKDTLIGGVLSGITTVAQSADRNIGEFFGNGRSMKSSSAASVTHTNNASAKVTNHINVTVPPGTDAHGIANTVEERLSSRMGDYTAAMVAVE